MKFIALFISVLSVFFIQAQNTLCQDSTNTVRKDSIERTLDEVIVTRKLINDNGMTKSYLITKDMRKKADNTAQLIGNLPGMNTDRMTNVIKYLGRDRIKILVDSIEKNEEHIKKLSPNRFERVEVTVMPAGRYAGYDVLINLRLKPSYSGLEANLSTYENLNPEYLRKDKLAMAYSSGMFDYMNDRWNFYVDESFQWVNSESQESYVKEFPLLGIVEKTIPNPAGIPTAHEYIRQNNVSINLDHSFNRNHTVGLVYRFSLSDNDGKTHMEILSTDTQSSTTDNFTELCKTESDTHTHTAGIFYEGRDIRGWNAGAKLNYSMNRYRSVNSTSRSNGYSNMYNTRPKMYYTFASINLSRQFFDRLDLSLEYNFTKRNRDIDEGLSGVMLAKLRENRQYAGIGVDFMIAPMTFLSAGCWYLHDITTSSGTTVKNSLLGFRAMARHTFNNSLSVMMSYYTSSSNPTSSQLSDYGQFSSQIQYIGGNPDLKTAFLHYLIADINLFGMFTLSGNCLYFKNFIGNIDVACNGMRPDGTEGSYVASIPANFDKWQTGTKLSFYRNIGPFSLDMSLSYSHERSVSRQSKSIAKNNVTFDSKLSYYCRPISLFTSLTYASPSRFFISSPQSWGDFRNDRLRVTVSKSFLKRSLDIMAEYCLPVHLMENREYSYSDSPAMKSTEISSTPRLSDNSIFLSISYRFSKGKGINRFRKEIHEEY